jgi:hypothetical protein
MGYSAGLLACAVVGTLVFGMFSAGSAVLGN